MKGHNAACLDVRTVMETLWQHSPWFDLQSYGDSDDVEYVPFRRLIRNTFEVYDFSSGPH
jgi:hypothetical protein